MLIKMNNKIIAQYWPFIRETVLESLPTSPDMVPDRMARLFDMALLDQVQCWIMVEGNDILGISVTRISEDDLSGSKAILIYALKFYKRMGREKREELWDTFKKYAKEEGAQVITAFCALETDARSIIQSNKQGAITYYVTMPT